MHIINIDHATGSDMNTTVLIVEDSPDIRSGLQIALESQGYSVVAAVDGRDGMRMFRDHNPDIALLDIRMPKLSGIDVCTLIRNESDIPIIMFSGVNERDDVVLAIKRGATDYILKDTGFRELLNRVSMHVRKRAAELLTTSPGRRSPGQVLPFTRPAALVPEVAGLVGPKANVPRPPVDLSRLNVKTVRVEPAASHQGASGGLLEDLVVIAHSEPDSLKQLASIAGRTRLEVAQAMTGQEAIEILATRSPKLMLVGNILTDMNCLTVIEAVQNHRLGELMGTILAIGKRAPELTRRARYMGVNDIIFKPWDDGRLDLAIRSTLNTTRQLGAGLRAA